MLNILWFLFFLLAFIASLYQWLVLGNSGIFNDIVQNLFKYANIAFEIALGLTGIMCLWLGLMKIAEKAGLVQLIAKGLSPLFERIMPSVPKNHPALGSITMNMVANMLGLDNAATPLGLKAMSDLQSINKSKDTASDAQIFFLVLNASSVTLLPMSIFMYRSQQGAPEPTMVFIPILLATACSTLAGFLYVSIAQRIKLWDPVILAYLSGFALVIGGTGYFLNQLPQEEMNRQSTLIGNLLLFSIVMTFLIAGFTQKVPLYETFVEGAKEGFTIAIKIIPYLVAMLIAIACLRASGLLDGILHIIKSGVTTIGWDTSFVDALPTALIKPFSGSGARGMMLETMQNHGVDSLPAVMATIIQGSTETTFYVIAVYFGSVGITKTRYAIPGGLFAEVAGVVAAILIGYWFFGQ
ncbi:MAG: nucleoside recognition domain-containing protein [Verrucomicrobiota bacterium]